MSPRTEDELEQPTQARTEIDPGDLAHRIVEVASDKKASDVVLLRTAEVTTMADYFVICSGRSDRQVQVLGHAIVDEAIERDVSAIVLGVSHDRPLGELDLGRTASYVVEHAPCQVIVLRSALQER